MGAAQPWSTGERRSLCTCCQGSLVGPHCSGDPQPAAGVRERPLRYHAPNRRWRCRHCRIAGATAPLKRDALLEAVTGSERHALRWTLRDAGEEPLSP